MSCARQGAGTSHRTACFSCLPTGSGSPLIRWCGCGVRDDRRPERRPRLSRRWGSPRHPERGGRSSRWRVGCRWPRHGSDAAVGDHAAGQFAACAGWRPGAQDALPGQDRRPALGEDRCHADARRERRPIVSCQRRATAAPVRCGRTVVEVVRRDSVAPLRNGHRFPRPMKFQRSTSRSLRRQRPRNGREERGGDESGGE